MYFQCSTNNKSPVWSSWHFVRWQLPKKLGGGFEYLVNFKDMWVKHNRDLIKLASRRYNFPPLLLAGICWNEVAGDPQFIDAPAHILRSFDWSGPDTIDKTLTVTKRPEKTSFGPVSMQLRVAAKTLDYDIGSMSVLDRHKLGRCLEVDAFNIDLAGKHIRELIDHDKLQDTPPHLNDEAVKVAGTRYNRGTREDLTILKKNLDYGTAIINRKQKLNMLLMV